MDQFNNHPLYRRHNIDSAMSSLWEFYKKYFVTLFLTSFAMSLVIQYSSTMIDFKDLQSTTDPMLLLEKFKSYLVPILVISLINLLFTTILQYYIIFKPVESENNILTSALKSLKFFIPYLIILVFLLFFGAIAIILGVFAVIVGAFFAMIYVMTLYLFILPIMMIEGPDILKTISRTFRLAHRNFWPNMGWVSVFLIIFIVVSVIFSSIILIPFSGNFLKTIMNPEAGGELMNYTTNPLFIILSALFSALTLPLLPILACILYFNGRASEDQQRRPVPSYNKDSDRVRVEDLYAKPYSDDHPENPEKKD
jgi:hypothetical protein